MNIIHSESLELAVSSFPELRFSKREVERVSKHLRSTLPYSADDEEHVQHIFRVANNWRDSHTFPMFRMRQALTGQLTRNKLTGVTAARVKRMSSIRRKLRRKPINLRDIQDLGGCRAILRSMDEVRTLVDALTQNFPHVCHRDNDYISKPKNTGYRSRHLVFKFQGAEREEQYNGLSIELQIRSHLQHSWATAVEAVGLFLREDLKSGEGNPDWLRLFELMSSELALAEKCPEVPLAPSTRLRRKEIADLDKKINASNTLENLRHIFHYTDNYYSTLKGKYYLIRYYRHTGQVTMQDFSNPSTAALAYDKAEEEAVKAPLGAKFNVVLVEVDELESLKQAYPNYYGDVKLFNQSLQSILNGRDVKEFVMRPKVQVASPQKESKDMSWLPRYARPDPRVK